MYDCLIIGAGPAGSYAAGQIAGSGFRVLVLEEHPRIGFPVHCAGIVGEDTIKEFGIPAGCVEKKLTSLKVFSPSGNIFSLPFINASVVNREKMDLFFAHEAQSAGAEYILETKALEIVQNREYVKVIYKNKDKTKDIQAKICIIASGATSDLPRNSGLSAPERYYMIAQAEFFIDQIDGAEIYIGKSFAPGSFAYGVSNGKNKARIGLIARAGVKECFENLLESPLLKDRLIKPKSSGSSQLADGANHILEDNPVKPENGLIFRRIPFGIPRKTVAGRIISVGDAASQVKTTTGGGVHFGLTGANILADTVRRAYNGNDFAPEVLEEYDFLWKKELAPELETGLLIRNFFEKAEDGELERLIELLGNPAVLRELSCHTNFNRHRELITSFLNSFPLQY